MVKIFPALLLNYISVQHHHSTRLITSQSFHTQETNTGNLCYYTNLRIGYSIQSWLFDITSDGSKKYRKLRCADYFPFWVKTRNRGEWCGDGDFLFKKQALI